MLKRVLLLSGIGLSLALLWFAVSNNRAAFPLAEENLRGVALSIAAAVENIAAHDPTLHALNTLRPKDLAFLAVLDKNGIYRFHSNPDLVGTRSEDDRYPEVVQKGATKEGRVMLGTGEKAYEFLTPLHLPDTTMILRLTLHTYRADAVIRKSELNMTILLSLLLVGWIMAASIYRFAVREEIHTLEMARQENMAHLGEMGAMLAHEIRNPLAGIKGYAQIIEKKPQDERNSGFARRIVAEAQRLETLVSDLLAYARSDRAMATVDMCEVIAHTAAFLRHEAEQLHVNIITECPEGMLITGNRDRLGQALLNLGKNAIQAMPEGGTLRITAGADGKQVVIRVKDSGHGIGPGELPRIFEPFFTTKAKGTGLGLALCKKITEEHGGSIEVHSTVGQGTTVSITIPVRRNHQGRS